MASDIRNHAPTARQAAGRLATCRSKQVDRLRRAVVEATVSDDSAATEQVSSAGRETSFGSSLSSSFGGGQL